MPLSNDKCDNLKGLVMKYKHFREIEPSNKMDFIMLYFAACRSLHELENAIRRTNNGNLTCRQAWLLRTHSIQTDTNGGIMEEIWD